MTDQTQVCECGYCGTKAELIPNPEPDEKKRSFFAKVVFARHTDLCGLECEGSGKSPDDHSLLHGSHLVAKDGQPEHLSAPLL